MRDRAWDLIDSVLTDDKQRARLRTLRCKPLSDRYGIQENNPSAEGPFAFLVLERSDILGDYCERPEMLLDICDWYLCTYGEQIWSYVEDSTVPHVVKFWSEPEDGYEYIATVLRYLHAKVHAQRLTDRENDCFDGYGVPVPPERILEVRTFETSP